MVLHPSLLLVWNGLVLAGIAFVYVFVTRRRARIYLLVDHLGALARAALPLQTGLRVVGRDLGGLAGIRLSRLAHRLEEGQSLGEAFESVPEAAPPVVRRMASLGDRSGNLAGFLEQLRASYRRLAELPAQSIYYFVYPLVLTLFISGAVSAMHVVVVPRMAEVFDQMAMTNRYAAWIPRLALLNQAVIACSMGLLLFICAGGGSVHFGSWVTRMMERTVSRIALRIPLLGRALRDGSLAAFSLTAALFLRAGATLVEAVRAAAESERQQTLRRAYERIARAVEEGGTFSEAVRKERWLPGEFAWFVETGERTGSLPETLAQASAHYETRVGLGRQMALRSSMPIFTLLNGSLVLGTALVILLPLRDLVMWVPAW